MKIGITGSRGGMTLLQLETFLNVIEEMDIEEVHQGCCNGVDEMATIACKDRNITVIGHPPTNDKELSELAVEKSSAVRKQAEYLERNRNIVDSVDLLIAIPNTDKEQVRSGTWSTVRYARKRSKKIIIIYPNGSKWTSFGKSR